MAENILVVEHEPRYNDRVKLALSGQPFTPLFAKDGDEAIRALDGQPPRLIVLSSVVPKISATDLIRVFRQRLGDIPILLTVSGYSGKSTKQDAVRLGASDILAKPFTESEFLGKIHHLLGVPPQSQLTSNEIFGDIVEQENAAGPRKAVNPSDNIDKMLADTLGGMMGKRSTSAGTTPRPVTSPGSAATPPAKLRPSATSAEIDKMLQDTLSGLEKKKNTAPLPSKPPGPPAAASSTQFIPSAPAPPPQMRPAVVPDRTPGPQPVFTSAGAQPAKEEEDPKDGTRFGQYVLLERIANGGMAEVWKARKRGEEGFQKIVAIKKILPHLSDNQDFIEMFIDEAKLAAQLNHNNIVHIYDLGKIQSSYYIAMEYVDGHDLKTIIRRGGERDQTLTVELALFIASKIAAALDYAHRKRDFDEKEIGLVHRDVSPQNVLISHEGDIKLCDFGIAKAASKASHTQAGALKGKVQYMSPEQAWGHNLDKRSDIFALGTVLFEMLTGRKLFAGDNEISVLEQVRQARITPPSQLNEDATPEIDAVVMKALQKDPADRYQTAGEMARDLESILYTFRPTPTSADLAIYMSRLWSEEPVMAPRMETAPAIVHAPGPFAPAVAASHVVAAVAAPAALSSSGPAMPAWDAPDFATEKKRSAVAPLAIAALIVAGIAGGFFFMRGRSSNSGAPARESLSAQPPQSGQRAVTAPPAATTIGEGVAANGAAVPLTDTTVSQKPAALDTALINLEVQKRLATERARLDEKARVQQTATAAPAPRPLLTQAPPPSATQAVVTAAPQPVPTVTTAPAPTATVAESSPAPQPPAEATTEAPRVREGDLVTAGTEGLISAKMLRLAVVPYPPMARAQRVQGTVILSALVSETGQVLEVRVLKGITRSVGLNEAAEQMVRRSTFAPPTKDGVRVKAWTTVPVNFKL